VLLAGLIQLFQIVDGLVGFAATDEILDFVVVEFYLGVDVFFLIGRFLFVACVVFLVLIVRHISYNAP
jgi:hypothetical protein